MGGESVGNWIALGALALALFGTIAGFVKFASRVSYRFGQKDTEIAHLKADVDKLVAREETHADAMSAFREGIGTWSATLASLQEDMREVRHDMKNLITGRIVPARRGEN